MFGFVSGAAKPAPNFKLKMNAILNSSGRLGSQYAASFAVCGLMYSLTRSASKSYRNSEDALNEGIGMFTAGTLAAKTRFSWPQSIMAGSFLSIAMMGGLALRKKYIDDKGKKLIVP